MLDILVLYGLFRPFRWVSKAELFRVPVMGWNMWLNDYVLATRRPRVDPRHDGSLPRPPRARRAGAALSRGHAVARRATRPIKDGAFRLAIDANCPVIPIVVTGTSDALPQHGRVLRQRMHAHVRVLAPILPDAHPSADALRDATRAAIAAALPEANRPAEPGRAARAARGR